MPATPLVPNMRPCESHVNRWGYSSLINNGFLARTTYSYDVGLTSKDYGIVKSSDDLYNNMHMQEKLLHAYTEKSLGKTH
jgi:hypothetical protein